jgi:hypothetical protein
MKLRAGLSKAIINAAWCFMPLIAFSQDQQITLKHGVYVRQETPCKDAPNAAIISWDGVGFSGAHSSKCTSRVVHTDGMQFRVNTTCSALGDGSPNPAGHDYVDSFLLTQLSNTRFEVLRKSQGKNAYRWCSSKNINWRPVKIERAG